MDSVTFKYVSGLTYSRTYPVLKLKGLDDPDEVELFPPFQRVVADGSIIEQIKGFRRIITATCGVLNDVADRQFMLNFLQHSVRSVLFGAEAEIPCVLNDVLGFENQWLYDTSLSRYFEIKLKDINVYSSWPSFIQPIPDLLMYIKTKVEIVGTEASPQVFTTNTAPLATDDTGNPYPSILLTNYAVSVIVTEYQDSLVNRVSDITQSGANISFSLAHSDIGNPYVDGKWYATIVIALQAK